MLRAMRLEAQRTRCPQRRRSEPAGGRGGRKDAQGLPRWGQGCPTVGRGTQFVPLSPRMRSWQLPARPACLPSFSLSSRQLNCLHSFFFFSLCKKTACPSDLSKSSTAAPDGETPRSRTPARLQNMPCATSGHGRSPCAFQQPPVQEVFFGLMAIFARFSKAGREAAALVSPTSPSLSLLFRTHQPISTFWYQI